MSVVRDMRVGAGLTQRELAAAAGTSQSTIAAYESGTKSPTLRTVDNLAASIGLELVAGFMPRMSREDRRSLALHGLVAERIRSDPAATLARATRHLDKLQAMHPHASRLLDRWRAWLELPTEQLIARMLDRAPEARDMRQVSPFAGILSTGERARALRRFRRSEGQ